VIAALAPFTFANEPLPQPYHQYVLNGTVLRASNGPKALFIVSLTGKFSMIRSDSAVDLSAVYSYHQGDRTQSITDSSGAFSLQVTLGMKADSLALKVAAPDKPVVIGGLFGIPNVGVEVTGTFGETEPGSSGCSKDPVTTTQIIGYRYTLPDKSIVIP
ncbi:MAG TPA: hypothetical protein VF514_05460, partial [Bacteroidota bacterium]